MGSAASGAVCVPVARCSGASACHICATRREPSRSMAVTHGYSTQPTSAYVSPAHGHSGLPTFQAGHEGSIPFARSNPKPQLRTLVSMSMVAIRKPCPGLVPVACPKGTGEYPFSPPTARSPSRQQSPGPVPEMRALAESDIATLGMPFMKGRVWRFIEVGRAVLAPAVVGCVGGPVSGGGSLPGDSDADMDAE